MQISSGALYSPREGSKESFQNPSSLRGALPYSKRKLRKSKARESAPPTILNRARKRITHPPPWSPLLCIFCLLGGAHSALCAHRVDAGERVGAQGMETPRYSSCVLIGLSSPRQRRVAIFCRNFEGKGDFFATPENFRARAKKAIRRYYSTFGPTP